MIRRWLLSIALLLGLLAPAAATLTTTNLAGFNAYTAAVAGGGPATITFQQCATNTTDGSSFTFSAQNTGTASSDRATIVGILIEDAAALHSINSVTVGGDSATEVVDQGAAGVLVNSAIYILDNPTGTSEDIVVTPSETVTSMSICVWQANNLESTTATDTASDGDTDANPMTLDLDVSADGIAVAVCADVSAGGTTYTWVGLTERDDATPGEHTRSAADYDEDSSASVPLTASCDSSNAGAQDQTGAAASFR